jgi:hypothetical protein
MSSHNGRTPQNSPNTSIVAGAGISLEDVIATKKLASRPSRSPDLEKENAALKMLAENFAKSPETILNKLVELAVDLCGAGTAGISLEETTSDGQVVPLRPWCKRLVQLGIFG